MTESLIWVDALIAGILLVSLLIGLFRGFVKEVFSLASWIVAVWVAIRLGPMVAEQFLASIDSPTARLGAAYAGVFICVLIAGAVISHLLTLLVNRTHLQGTDRSLGLLFGLLRGAVIVTALVLLARQTPMPQEPWWQRSVMLSQFEILADWVAEQLPPGWLPERPSTASLIPAYPVSPRPSPAPQEP